VAAVIAELRIICLRCCKDHQAGHICGRERGDWNTQRLADHRCMCDTCYRAHVEGRMA
jgi:hypothetical protein